MKKGTPGPQFLSRYLTIQKKKMTDKEYINLKNKYESLRDKNIREINKSETEAVRQLIFVATIFLTASLFVLQVNESRPLTDTYKVLLVMSWVGFSTSMALGITIFVKDRKFFETWANAAEKMAHAISEKIPKSQAEVNALENIQFNDLLENTPDTTLRLQILFLAIGVICLFIVGSKIIL